MMSLICIYTRVRKTKQTLVAKLGTYLCVNIDEPVEVPLFWTVLEGFFGEYHSSSAVLGRQCSDITKQPPVS